MPEALPGDRTPPLSPHVQVWRWHVTMTASILHRATGALLYVGALVLAGWALALASGVDAYRRYLAVVASPPGKVVLFLITLSLFFHLANGIRHLFWDAGVGLETASANKTAWAAFAFALVAAVGLWIFLAAPLSLG